MLSKNAPPKFNKKIPFSRPTVKMAEVYFHTLLVYKLVVGHCQSAGWEKKAHFCLRAYLSIMFVSFNLFLRLLTSRLSMTLLALQTVSAKSNLAAMELAKQEVYRIQLMFTACASKTVRPYIHTNL